MKCQTARARLEAWHDGELPFWTGSIIAWHLRRCSACAREAACLARLARAVEQANPLKRERHPVLPVPLGRVAAVAICVTSLIVVGVATRPTTPRPSSNTAWPAKQTQASPVLSEASSLPRPATPRPILSRKTAVRATFRTVTVRHRATRRKRFLRAASLPGYVTRVAPLWPVKSRPQVVAPSPDTKPDTETIVVSVREATPEECARQQREQSCIYVETTPPDYMLLVQSEPRNAAL